MKNYIFLFCSLFVLTLFSCSTDEDLAHDTQEIEIKLRDKPNTNPNGEVYDVYYAAAFCGGYDDQIQIWVSDYDVCQCLLNDFIWDCTKNGGQLTEGSDIVCKHTTSTIAPLNPYCSK